MVGFLPPDIILKYFQGKDKARSRGSSESFMYLFPNKTIKIETNLIFEKSHEIYIYIYIYITMCKT